MSWNLRPTCVTSQSTSGAGLCRALHRAILLIALALTSATDGGTFTVNGTVRIAAMDSPILAGRGGALTTSFARLGDGRTGVVQSDRNDGRDDSNVATVSITVGNVNRPPIARDDRYSTTKDRAFLISAPGVLVNDTDLKGLPLTAKLVQRAVHGFALLNANGSFFYLPAKEFVGKDTFTYTASNGLNTSNLARVTIDVTRECGHHEENDDRDNTRERRHNEENDDRDYTRERGHKEENDDCPPTAPTNLAVAAAGTAQINLSWTNTSTTQTGVKVERSIDNVTFAQITMAGASAVSYSDIGLSASTTYFYRVRATSSSGDSPYSNTASATTQSAVPTLVQNLSTYTNRDVEAGNDFIINLANPTLANNCLILALTNAYSSTRTITVSDDKGNPWTTGPHTDFVANNETTTIFYALGVAAGTQSITIHFDASIFNVHATVSEWYNIATTAAVSGSSAASDVASPVSPGAFTPGNNDANGGNLIYHHAIAIPGAGSLGNLASFVSAINVDTGFTLASANRELASISQYTVQTTAAAINPTLTVGEADHFNTIAVAFKAAVAGTAPSTKGIRVQNMQHTFHPWSGSSTVNLPSSGNLLVLSAPVNTGQDEITGVTDSKGNAWTKVAGESPDSPQFWYAVNATPSNDLTISFDLANNTSIVVIAWDIIGAATAPFDKFSEATGAQILAGDDITGAPVITPTTANGLVIGLVNEYTGPPTSMIGAGYVADHIFYTGQTDASILDLGDGTAHIYNSDTSPLSFGWHQTTHPPTTGWFAIAVALKAAP
jgi:hypothetical protein